MTVGEYTHSVLSMNDTLMAGNSVIPPDHGIITLIVLS